MTHDELCRRSVQWMLGTMRAVAAATFPEPDAFGWLANGHTHLIEVKVSRSDFLRDRKKYSRLNEGKGYPVMGGQRWYVTLPGVVRPSDDLGRWGLVELRRDRMYRVRDAAWNYSKDRDMRGEAALAVQCMRLAVNGGSVRCGMRYLRASHWADEVDVVRAVLDDAVAVDGRVA